MATGTLEESVEFAAKLIKKNPDISMTELKKAAKPIGIRIYPLAIGKAKVSLGMGKKRASLSVDSDRSSVEGDKKPGMVRHQLFQEDIHCEVCAL